MTNRAATEPIGVILLVGVVIVATVTLGGGLLTKANAIADQTDTTHINIKTEVNETAVTVRHVGGPNFETADVRFLLVGDTGRVGPYALDASEVSGSGLDDGSFDVGDEATLSHSFTGYIDIYLLDADSGDRLHRSLRSALPETTGPTAVANSLDQVAEGYSITLDGSGSSDPDDDIVSYSWAITSGVGSIVEDDTATPNATYSAPANVTGDQTVTIELTVTDDDGNTDTDTITVTVVDVDGAEAPGDGDAFDDPNGNGVYDEGETVITKEDLEDGFNEPETDLVIYPSVGTVEPQQGSRPVDITAKTITAGSDFSAKGGGDIRLTATGDIRINGSTLDSNGNKATINITSTNGRIFANGTTMSLKANGQIELNSNGTIDLTMADLTAGGYTADLTTPEATLYVENLTLNGNGPLTYDPDNITVVPSGAGNVSP